MDIGSNWGGLEFLRVAAGCLASGIDDPIVYFWMHIETDKGKRGIEVFEEQERIGEKFLHKILESDDGREGFMKKLAALDPDSPLEIPLASVEARIRKLYTDLTYRREVFNRYTQVKYLFEIYRDRGYIHELDQKIISGHCIIRKLEDLAFQKSFGEPKAGNM